MAETFNYRAEYVLEDERVLIRPLKAKDIDFLLPYALNEPDTWRYSMINAAGRDGMNDYVHNALMAREAAKEYPFIILDKQTGAFAGSTRFYDIQPQYQTLQLGYTWYGEDYRGAGLNKHCKFLLLQFAFDEVGMMRVEFRADARNDRSIAAMKSIGCKVEGILRSHFPLHSGGRRDSIVLSILKDEWDDEVKEKLSSKLSL
jgi:RimJ/RimL family protein N-acetyltransferase